MPAPAFREVLMPARYYQTSKVVTLTPSQNNDASHVDVTGASGVSWTVSANNSNVLATALPQVTTTDDKQLNLAPGALPGGTDTNAVMANVGGVVAGVDLSTATQRVVIMRPLLAVPPYGAGALLGLKSAWLTLTRSAAGTASTDYTVVTTVYYP